MLATVLSAVLTPRTRFYASGRFLAPVRGSKSSGLGRKGWELCDLVRLNYVIVSFEFAATALVWGQLDLISNLLCCIYWNCYVMPAVFVTVPIKLVTFKLHLQLWMEYQDFLPPFLLTLVPSAQCSNAAAASRADWGKRSIVFCVPSEHHQQKQRAPDPLVAYRNEKIEGETPQVSRGRTHLCESVKIYICVYPDLTAKKERFRANLRKWIWQSPMETSQLGSIAL